MGSSIPRIILSFLAVAAITAPALVILFVPPAAAQATGTCERGQATDKTWQDIVVKSLSVERLDPTMTVSKSGQWVFVSKAGDILVKVVVRNQEGLAINTPFVVRLLDVKPDATIVELGDRTVNSLAGNTDSAELRYSVENYAGTGEHTLRVVADATKKVDERCVETVNNTPAPGGTTVVRENNNQLNQSVLHTAKPDLRITSLVAESEVRAFKTASATTKIFFNATISNAGNHRAFNTENAAAGFLALFKVENDEAPCKQASNTVAVVDLAAGATKQVHVKCEIAGRTKDFNVSVDIDSGGKVVEANEANNAFKRLFHLRIADLTANVTGVTGASSENAVPEFGTLGLTAVVRNVGDANATSDTNTNFTWHVFLDSKAEGNELSPDAGFTTKLAPGASTEATFTIKPIERNLAPGTHRIIVVADANEAGDTAPGVVIETTEANNEKVFEFIVAEFVENLTAENISKKVSPGVEVVYPFNLTNEGNANDTVQFGFTGAAVSPRVTLPNGTAVSGAVKIQNGTTLPFHLVVPVPKDAAENTTVNVTLTATSTVPKANAGDDITFRTDVGPDVIAPLIEKITPSATILGSGDLEFKVTDNVAVTQVQYQIGTGAATTVTSAGSDVYKVPAPGSDGAFKVTITATDAKGNDASEEFNLIKDTEAPDITSIAVQEAAARSPAGVDPNTPVTVTAQISDPNIKNATVVVGSSKAEMVRQAGEVWQSRGLRAPAAPGEYRIVIYAFDEGGNMARAVEDLDRIRVKGVDLLLFEPTGSPPNPQEGDFVTIAAKVGNAGNELASGVLVRFLVDGTLVETKTFDIPANSQANAAFRWQVEPGPHEFSLLVDPDGLFTETNELNNGITLEAGGPNGLFPQARVFTTGATENDLPDLLVKYLWVLLIGLAAVAVGVAAFVVKPA